MIRYVGNFENVRIYETSYFSLGMGLTLPDLGILVGEGVFSKNLDPWLIKHEYGHILQKRKHGHFKFYTQIGLQSLWSALKQSYMKNYYHVLHPVEINANRLAYKYFNEPEDWPIKRFPLSY
jgi:hypothetical protein